MFYFLSKALLFFLNPLIWILSLLIYSLLTKSQSRKKKSIWLSIAIVLIFSNPLIIHHVYKWWEPDNINVSDITQPYDVGVVLSGYTDLSPRTDRAYFYYMGHGHRLDHALELYRLGKVEKLMLSGFIGSPQMTKYTLDYLHRNDIAHNDIIVEDRSMNTYQSALMFSDNIPMGLDTTSLLLITSAFHMPRAKMCFDKAGVQVTPFGVDRTPLSFQYSFNKVLPNAKVIAAWQKIIKEWVGIIVYKIMGYI